MQYRFFEQLPKLIEAKLVSARLHPRLPLSIYNYTAQAQHSPLVEWTEAMVDCRGLILDNEGEIVGRPFRKFWNYSQVLDRIPSEPFTVWEKLDGSLGICASYAGERVVATRGSFESDQAKWFDGWMRRHRNDFLPSDGLTFLFELIYPGNRIVVDYGDTEAPFLLSIMSPDAVDLCNLFERETRFRKARRFDAVKDFSQINGPEFAGQEGFVVRWASGFMAKLKLDEYCRLHRLITQCSTRTIWEMLRTGTDTRELLDRVPAEFAEWASAQIRGTSEAQADILRWADDTMRGAPPGEPRKDFAMWAKRQKHPSLLFSRLDNKDISDAAWKLVEPRWATPFRKDIDA